MSDTERHKKVDRPNEYLQAYLDGQLTDDALIQEIESRLETDPEFAQELRTLEALRDSLRELPKAKAPAYLRDRVRSAMREAAPHTPGRRFRYEWLAAACILAVIATAGWWPRTADRPTDPNGALAGFVEDHIALLQSDQADVRSDDPRVLEEWFRERLDYVPAVPRWEWMQPVSGQICYVDGKRAARVSYRIGDDEVSLFIQPQMEPGKMEAMGATSPDKAMVEIMRGYKIACWGKKEMDYILIAQVSADKVFDRLKQTRA